MSNEYKLSPEMDIEVGSQTYRLDPSFKTLKGLQHAFRADLVDLQAQVVFMRQDELARFIAIASGKPEEEVGQLIVDEVDVLSNDYQVLKALLMSWLAVAMSPKKDRAKKAEEAAMTLGRLISRLSLGNSTKSSPTEP